VDDIPGAIKELEHERKLGLAGAFVPGRFQPGGGRLQCAVSGLFAAEPGERRLITVIR